MKTARLAVALAALPIALTLTAPAPAHATPRASAGDGAYVVTQTQVDSRTLDLTVWSPAIASTTQVRLLLPPGWSPAAGRTWPVLYLLHGCCDTYQGWTQNTNVESVTQGAPVIVALPDGGGGGLYTDWWNNGSGGPRWEDFVATELPQILASGYRANGVAAIGGVSTGGGAALFIAAHHPGQYTAVASYSGTDCISLPPAQELIEATLIRAGLNPTGPWGNPFATPNQWGAHDPCSLVSDLRGLKIFLSVGSGVTFSGNPYPCAPGGDILESSVAPGVYTFALDLTLNGIPYTTDFYGGGCHSWPYWQNTFAQSWPMLESALGA
jgi:S-formylglutathione hydrolase FrmB